MALKIHRASDPIEVTQIKMLVYGQPGIGKSSFGFTAEAPLTLDFDDGARRSSFRQDIVQIGSWADANSITAEDRRHSGLKDVILGDLPAGWKGPFVVGILSAAGSGLLAIHWLLGYVRQHNYSVFVVYRLILAAVILLLIATGVREATF